MSNNRATPDDLKGMAAIGTADLYPGRVKIIIGSGTCGLAMGARDIEETAIKTVRRLNAAALVTKTGCIGFCAREPLMDIVLPNGPRISYADMTPEKTRAVLTAFF